MKAGEGSTEINAGDPSGPALGSTGTELNSEVVALPLLSGSKHPNLSSQLFHECSL